MRNKFPAFIALLCILVYSGAVLYGAYRVYSSIESQKQLAVKELDEIEKFISQRSSSFVTEPFREEINIRLKECTSLQGIIITGSHGSIPFEKDTGSVIQFDPNPSFIPRFGYTTLKARQIDIPGFRNVNIHSTLNTINYEELVFVLRQTLIVILGGLLLSFLTMMITALRSRTAAKTDTTFTKDTSAKPAEDLSDDFFTGFDDNIEENKADDFSVPEPDFSAGYTSSSDASEYASDFTSEYAPEYTSEDSFAEQTNNRSDTDDVFELPDFDDFSDTNDTDSSDDGFHLDDFLDESDLDLPVQAPSPVKTEKPNGLYSPRSNIGWEAYIHDRLASELHRCASSEQDLVVLRMECGDRVNCDETLYKKIADEAVDLFNLRDLSFEHGDCGITVIIPNAGLEQGISKTETFHARLFRNCSNSFNAKNDFLTGISSRSGRLIDADRLLLEAEKALEKAKTDTASPIIAFKSDPEKYRDFIKKTNSP